MPLVCSSLRFRPSARDPLSVTTFPIGSGNPSFLTDVNGKLPPAGERPPANFDWLAYIKFSSDLKAAGIDNKADAEEHFMTYGRFEGRLHLETKLTVRYVTSSNLISERPCKTIHFKFKSLLNIILIGCFKASN